MPTSVLANKKKNEGREVIDVDAVDTSIFDSIPDSAILSMDDSGAKNIVVKNHTNIPKSLKTHIKIKCGIYLIV